MKKVAAWDICESLLRLMMTQLGIEEYTVRQTRPGCWIAEVESK